MEGCRSNVPFAVHSDSDCAIVFRPALLSMIPRVTDAEIMQAFESTVVSADHCADESAASVSASLRNLNIQNNVLFRMIVHSKQFQERSSGMLNGRYLLLCVCHAFLRCDFANIFVLDVVWIVSVFHWR